MTTQTAVGSEVGPSIPAAYVRHHPIMIARAEGSRLFDARGRSYVDFAGGIGVMNVGHRHPYVVEALHRQVDAVTHVGPVALHEGYAKLATELASRTPGKGLKQVLLVNSGAEAVENAVKIARHATGRSAIVTFDRAFHGRTLLTSAMNGRVDPYKMQPGSIAPDIFRAPYPYAFRPPIGVAVEDLTDHCLEQLESLTTTQVRANNVAAVVIEPIQGEGGYIVPTPRFLRGVRDWCDRVGALLVADEIQTGYGRTGRMFAVEHEDVFPDILVLGKSIAAGLPLAAVIAPESVMGNTHRGDVGGTYGGNPLACAAALAVLAVFDEEPLLERAVHIGAHTHQLLENVASDLPGIGDVRGRGAMVAVELVKSRRDHQPNPEATARIIAAAREAGVIVIKTGVYDNVIRLLPSLTISDDELEVGLAALVKAFESDSEPSRQSA